MQLGYRRSWFVDPDLRVFAHAFSFIPCRGFSSFVVSVELDERTPPDELKPIVSEAYSARY